MTSKRSLKESIRYACGDVAGECLLAKMTFEDLDEDKIENIVCQIALLQIDTTDKVSTKFDKKVADFADVKTYREARKKYFKTYYASLWKEFIASLEKIVEEMNTMLTPEQKEINKKVANN